MKILAGSKVSVRSHNFADRYFVVNATKPRQVSCVEMDGLLIREYLLSIDRSPAVCIVLSTGDN